MAIWPVLYWGWIYSVPIADPAERALRAGRCLQEWRSDEVRDRVRNTCIRIFSYI